MHQPSHCEIVITYNIMLTSILVWAILTIHPIIEMEQMGSTNSYIWCSVFIYQLAQCSYTSTKPINFNANGNILLLTATITS